MIEEPLIDEFYELQARIATLGMELARTRGQEDGAAIESAPAFQKMLTMLGCGPRTTPGRDRYWQGEPGPKPA